MLLWQLNLEDAGGAQAEFSADFTASAALTASLTTGITPSASWGATATVAGTLTTAIRLALAAASTATWAADLTAGTPASLTWTLSDLNGDIIRQETVVPGALTETSWTLTPAERALITAWPLSVTVAKSGSQVDVTEVWLDHPAFTPYIYLAMRSGGQATAALTGTLSLPLSLWEKAIRFPLVAGEVGTPTLAASPVATPTLPASSSFLTPS